MTAVLITSVYDRHPCFIPVVAAVYDRRVFRFATS